MIWRVLCFVQSNETTRWGHADACSCIRRNAACTPLDDSPQVCELVVFLFGAITDWVEPFLAEQLG
jgi:hypothetical protein